WGNWQSVTHQVELQQGWNTVTLTKLTWYTELDALDVFPAEAPPVDPQVTVTAQPRCLGGTPYLAVRATNDGDETVAVALTTPHGERAFAQVDPGKSAYQSFKVRGGALEAGEALVAVTDVAGTTTEVTAAYDALTCA
ncbi:MAG: hypothetical protein ACTINV_10480, partial [Cellulosimicrobium funkei]